jgi:coatomer protein complex subunit alpha (xenin)
MVLFTRLSVSSQAWDDAGVFMRVKGKTVYRLDCSARPCTITFDPTEYHFKLAFLRNNYDEMPYIIRTLALLGQSIIAYLQQNGFPEVFFIYFLIPVRTTF